MNDTDDYLSYRMLTSYEWAEPFVYPFLKSFRKALVNKMTTLIVSISFEASVHMKRERKQYTKEETLALAAAIDTVHNEDVVILSKDKIRLCAFFKDRLSKLW